MKKPWERIAWLVVSVAALLIGLTTGKSAERSRMEKEVSEQSGEQRMNSQNRRTDSVKRDRDAKSNGAIKTKDQDELRNRAFQALSSSSRLQRQMGMVGVLDAMTADNWQSVWKEHVRQTIESGRVHNLEWSLTMQRVGEVAGREAMEYFEHNGQSEGTGNRAAVLVGWAAADPDAAFSWMASQGADSPNQGLWNDLLRGISERDPMMALKRIEEIPEQHRARGMFVVCDGLIQSGNLKDATSVLADMAAKIPAGSAPPRELMAFYHSLKSRVGFVDQLSDSYPEFNKQTPDMTTLDQIFQNPAQTQK